MSFSLLCNVATQFGAMTLSFSYVLVSVYAYMFCFKRRMSRSKGANEEWAAGVTIEMQVMQPKRAGELRF